MKRMEGLPPETADEPGLKLEDLLLDPVGAEAIRAAADGEWLESDVDS